VRFSRRVAGELRPNRLAAAIATARHAGATICDLTESNPTRAGFDYPPDMLSGLGLARGLRYAPEPLGLLSARQAISADFARRGIDAPAERTVLTASTSEAYSLLFKILCDPGDEVLVPRPSYPLFEHLTRLDAVAAVPYDLEYHGRWSVNMPSVEQALSSRTRALLVVNPNNPTGSFVSPAEADHLADICRDAGAAIIADEVFADYAWAAGPLRLSGLFVRRTDVLTFTLGGLSKSAGLPQVKLGWMVAAGPSDVVTDALARLDLACDTYLSVSTPVQLAAAELLRHGAAIRRQIQVRVTANHATLCARATETPACRVLQGDGGWYAVVQVPSIGSEEDMVLTLLATRGVLVHPGYFFDFPAVSFMVVSLLPPLDVFDAGVSHLLRHFDCSVGDS
jgi:aspartate/methionine/tyrosine aminotransferase